jgi:hypothetical protein
MPRIQILFIANDFVIIKCRFTWLKYPSKTILDECDGFWKRAFLADFMHIIILL